MTESAYQKFQNQKLILRDQLAIDRTILANERTLLSYVRTMIGFVALGGTILKLFHGPLMAPLGWTLIGFSMLTLLTGLSRYAKTSVNLHKVQDPNNHDHHLSYYLLQALSKLHITG